MKYIKQKADQRTEHYHNFRNCMHIKSWEEIYQNAVNFYFWVVLLFKVCLKLFHVFKILFYNRHASLFIISKTIFKLQTKKKIKAYYSIMERSYSVPDLDGYIQVLDYEVPPRVPLVSHYIFIHNPGNSVQKWSGRQAPTGQNRRPFLLVYHVLKETIAGKDVEISVLG